jgi:hypothetical protein
MTSNKLPKSQSKLTRHRADQVGTVNVLGNQAGVLLVRAAV